jgi:hypothetical protein
MLWRPAAPCCRKHYTEQHIRELSGEAQPSKVDV